MHHRPDAWAVLYGHVSCQGKGKDSKFVPVHARKAQGQAEVQFPSFWTLKVSGELHAAATLQQWRDSSTHWVGDFGGPTVGLDILQKRRISCPSWDWKPGSHNLQPNHLLTTLTQMLTWRVAVTIVSFWRVKLIQTISKVSVHTSQDTFYAYSTKTNHLMAWKE